eukprot:12727714-Prorocentrum_lima.AAC.1
MHAIWCDVEETLVERQYNPSHSRVVGMDFSAVLYADDTLLLANASGALSRLLSTLELVALEYGLQLNR